MSKTTSKPAPTVARGKTLYLVCVGVFFVTSVEYLASWNFYSQHKSFFNVRSLGEFVAWPTLATMFLLGSKDAKKTIIITTGAWIVFQMIVLLSQINRDFSTGLPFASFLSLTTISTLIVFSLKIIVIRILQSSLSLDLYLRFREACPLVWLYKAWPQLYPKAYIGPLGKMALVDQVFRDSYRASVEELFNSNYATVKRAKPPEEKPTVGKRQDLGVLAVRSRKLIVSDPSYAMEEYAIAIPSSSAAVSITPFKSTEYVTNYLLTVDFFPGSSRTDLTRNLIAKIPVDSAKVVLLDLADVNTFHNGEANAHAYFSGSAPINFLVEIQKRFDLELRRFNDEFVSDCIVPPILENQIRAYIEGNSKFTGRPECSFFVKKEPYFTLFSVHHSRLRFEDSGGELVKINVLADGEYSIYGNYRDGELRSLELNF